MKSYKSKVLTQTVIMFAIIIVSNVMIDLGTEGNLSRMMKHPLRFFGATILISLIGGYLVAKIYETTEKSDKNQSG